jgi:hypothetical protein
LRSVDAWRGQRREGYRLGHPSSGSAGEDAAVWTSEDGERWVRELDPSGSFGAIGEAAIKSLRADRLPVLAVGSAGSENGSDAAVWSADPLD